MCTGYIESSKSISLRLSLHVAYFWGLMQTTFVLYLVPSAVVVATVVVVVVAVALFKLHNWEEQREKPKRTEKLKENVCTKTTKRLTFLETFVLRFPFFFCLSLALPPSFHVLSVQLSLCLSVCVNAWACTKTAAHPVALTHTQTNIHTHVRPSQTSFIEFRKKKITKKKCK